MIEARNRPLAVVRHAAHYLINGEAVALHLQRDPAGDGLRLEHALK